MRPHTAFFYQTKTGFQRILSAAGLCSRAAVAAAAAGARGRPKRRVIYLSHWLETASSKGRSTRTSSCRERDIAEFRDVVRGLHFGSVYLSRSHACVCLTRARIVSPSASAHRQKSVFMFYRCKYNRRRRRRRPGDRFWHLESRDKHTSLYSRVCA